LRHRHANRLVDRKFQQGFAWNVYLLALGHDLYSRSRTSTHASANGCTLATANDGPDYRSYGCASTNLFSGVGSA